MHRVLLAVFTIAAALITATEDVEFNQRISELEKQLNARSSRTVRGVNGFLLRTHRPAEIKNKHIEGLKGFIEKWFNIRCDVIKAAKPRKRYREPDALNTI